MKKPKILLWDIETTNLNADFGYMLCFGYKWYGERQTHIISVSDFERSFQRDPTNDKQLVVEASEVLSSADVWVTWYGERFDVPYMLSKRLVHGLSVIDEKPHIDLWKTARRKLKLHSNRLASVSAFLGLPDKTKLSGPIWVRAMAGDKKAIDYVVRHCKQDVIVLEQAYDRMRPLVPQHPNVALVDEDVKTKRCPVCGSSRLIREGYRRLVTRAYQKYHCQECGRWCRGTARIYSVTVV